MWIFDVQEDMTTGRAVLMDLASSASWPSTKRRRRDVSYRVRSERLSTCPSTCATRRATRNAGDLTRRSRLPRNLLGVVLLLFGTPGHLILPAQAFYFQWSSTSYQCYTQTLSWVGGEPPFKAILAPILQMPFVYEIPDSAFVDGQGQYDITVQLTSGLSYVMMMGDATGMGTGGSSGRITVQGYAETACLGSASTNQTTLDLSFEVFQTNIQQCEKSFNMSWDLTPAARPPYNMTVVSLDQSFNPFDISFNDTTSYEWEVNVPAGKGFTVIMNDGKGYGYGGVADAYSVNRTGGNSQCDVIGGLGTTITTTGKMTSTRGTAGPTTSSAEPNTSDDGPPRSSIIAGASIGAVIGIGLSIAVAIFVFVCRRRRKRGRYQRGRKGDEQDGGNGIILADGRRRPNDAMSVNLFDDSEQYQDPNDGNYAPVPYEVGASSYSGSPVTPGTSNGMSRYMVGRGGDLSPSTTLTTTNLFDGRELHGDEASEAMALTGNRTWSGGSSFSDSLQSRADAVPLPYDRSRSSGLQRFDTVSDTRTMAGTGPGASPLGQRSGLPRTKSEEAVAEVESVAAAAASAAARGGGGRLASYPSTELSSTLSSVPLSSSGGFRVTNATDADPLVPPVGTNNASTGTGGRTRAGPRGEPRFVRHADAGRAPEVIDLPPLYTDLVIEDRPDEARRET